eukprot:11207447-Lingulodinium_polyedra.AAC.1
MTASADAGPPGPSHIAQKWPGGAGFHHWALRQVFLTPPRARRLGRGRARGPRRSAVAAEALAAQSTA